VRDAAAHDAPAIAAVHVRSRQPPRAAIALPTTGPPRSRHPAATRFYKRTGFVADGARQELRDLRVFQIRMVREPLA
jgi:hypothetical protein